MTVARRVIRIADVRAFSPPGHELDFASRLLIDAESVGSQQLTLNHFTLKPGRRTDEGKHPCPFDEVYCVLEGRATLRLGSDPPVLYDLEPGMVVFIPCETDHGLHNPGPTDLVLLTVMPRQPLPGANPVYDARKMAWGTSFRHVDGSEEVEGVPVADMH